MARGAGGLLDGGFVFKLGRLFRTPYGGEGVDFIDQLNYQFTGGLILIFIIIISLRQYVGKPIQCWVPPEFTRAWEEYTENYCWVSNTYFLLPHEDIPAEELEYEKIKFIGYYQWMSIVLAGQAMMSWVPHLLWRVCSRRLPLLLKSAKEASIPDRELRLKAVSCLVATLEEQAESQSRFRRMKSFVNRCLCGIAPNARLTFLFLFVRALFIANCLGQIYLMKCFTGFNSTFFGLQLLQDLTKGEEWDTSGHFPRVTYCNIKVRVMGQPKPASYSLQCVLPINNFVEKIYIFLWFWFVILCSLTIMNTIQWTINTMLPVRRVCYIKQYLKALRLISSTEERDCTRFVNQNLGADGIFILHIVSKIASDLIALDVTATLWKNYRQAKITGTEEDVNRLLETVNRGSSAV
ncbi:Innexin unc-9 [Echinococcus granulosus]|uniref:Innexin n=1 Tax=Echinococcus granulosus TaxID=6210 RepID=A0A068WYZ9_ECHGR|nr:Innexin unc-9 [Echinococcus granulosus]CDS22901.1 innexin unc 9 [Echinococcus granulosus]